MFPSIHSPDTLTVVCSVYSALVSQCHSGMVPWLHSAESQCHGIMVLWCHRVTVYQFHIGVSMVSENIFCLAARFDVVCQCINFYYKIAIKRPFALNYMSLLEQTGMHMQAYTV